MSNGAKSEYVPLSKLAETEAKIQLGKERATILKRIEKLEARLATIAGDATTGAKA